MELLANMNASQASNLSKIVRQQAICVSLLTEILCNPSCKLFDTLIQISTQIYTRVTDKILARFIQGTVSESQVINLVRLLIADMDMLGSQYRSFVPAINMTVLKLLDFAKLP